jgi:hypothetical protein
MNKYTVKRKLGINDLLCEFAFIGNSQGDESVSNEITDYKASQSWMSITKGFEDIINNQEAIYKESKRRFNANIDYIEKLKAENRYGEEYEINITLNPNLLFDNSNIKNESVLESHKLIFLNNG